MYKVILVDDESLVLKSLKGSIDWKSYGYEVVGQATDGEEALELIIKMEPDLVFTDIRMPCMSGLELIKRVKEYSLSTQFIVISGYAEFAYAQKAMNYGALGYCLKPFDDEEIIGLLKKVKGVLEKNRSSSLMAIFDEKGPEKVKKIDGTLRKLGFIMGSSFELTLLFVIGSGKLIFSNNVKHVHISKSVNRSIYIVQGVSPEEIALGIEEAFPEGINGVGICSVATTAELIEDAITNAEIFSYGYFIIGEKGVYGKFESNVLKKADLLIDQFEEYALKKDVSASLKVLHEIEGMLSSGSLTIIHTLRLYNSAVSYIGRLGDGMETTRLNYYDELTGKFNNASEMFEYLKGQICSFSGVRYEHSPEDIKNNTFKPVLKYVNQNFFLDISVQSIARDFIINPSYLSQMFKKEMNITFSDYLTRLRIDSAKHLLETGKLTIREISERCGYNDYFYFIKTFKKVTGVTPVSYRELNAK